MRASEFNSDRTVIRNINTKPALLITSGMNARARDMVCSTECNGCRFRKPTDISDKLASLRAVGCATGSVKSGDLPVSYIHNTPYPIDRQTSDRVRDTGAKPHGAKRLMHYGISLVCRGGPRRIQVRRAACVHCCIILRKRRVQRPRGNPIKAGHASMPPRLTVSTR